jgi:hypothetical protein
MWYQRNKYSEHILTLGDMELSLIAAPSRTGYRSFETRLLQQIKKLKAESELFGHRRTLKEHEPLMVVAPNDQHVDIQLPSTYRADRSDELFIMVYFSSLPITHCARTATPWFCFKKCILWAIFYLSERTFRWYSSSDNVRRSHFELPCVNKQNRSAANLNELHVKPLHSQRNSTVWDISLRYHWSLILPEWNWQCGYCDIWPVCAYIWWTNSCFQSYAVVIWTLLPSGSNKMEQQHILLGSRWTPYELC